MILHIMRAFKEIQEAVGNQKQEVLKRYANDDTVRKALWYQLNPYITFGLSDKKINKSILTRNYVAVVEKNDLFQMCDWLNSCNGISDAKLFNVQWWILNVASSVPDPKDILAVSDFLKFFFTKSIRLGVTAKTVNKVYGAGFIPEFSCMLANKYFEHQNVIEGKRFAVTKKLDGFRCLCVFENGKPTFFSRQGQVIEGLVEIKKDFMDLYARYDIDDQVFDGELLVDNAEDMESGDGYKETTKIVRKDGEKHGITYNVFDLIPLKEFRSGSGSEPYYLRSETLENLFGGMDLPHSKLLPILYEGTNINKMFYWLDYMREHHQEGVMINLLDAPYECKRTNNLLKVKVMQDCDLRITGYKEGKGRNVGVLGAFTVDYKGNSVDVGCGYSDTQRKDFWDQKDKLIGRVITVQYFEESEDSNGIKSLRFPVFKELREEGKEVSYT